MGKTDPFIQFYLTSFTQWVKLTVPTLETIAVVFLFVRLCVHIYRPSVSGVSRT